MNTLTSRNFRRIDSHINRVMAASAMRALDRGLGNQLVDVVIEISPAAPGAVYWHASDGRWGMYERRLSRSGRPIGSLTEWDGEWHRKV